MGKFGSRQLFDLYSVSEHADARAARWWLTVLHEGQQGIIVQPHRRPRFSNAMLTEVAMECRDLVAAMEAVRGGTLVGLADLTAVIDQATELYYDPVSPDQ